MLVSNTSSRQAIGRLLAFGTLSITTTFFNNGMMYNDNVDYSIDAMSESDSGTMTLSPSNVSIRPTTNYNMAKDVFGIELRDLTKEEAANYKKSLKKLYKPTGVNIFEIC